VALGFLGMTLVKLGQTNDRVGGSQVRIQRQRSIQLINGLGLAVGLIQDPAHQDVRPGIVRRL
jgi:hypothetical protein